MKKLMKAAGIFSAATALLFSMFLLTDIIYYYTGANANEILPEYIDVYRLSSKVADIPIERWEEGPYSYKMILKNDTTIQLSFSAITIDGKKVRIPMMIWWAKLSGIKNELDVKFTKRNNVKSVVERFLEGK